MNRRTLAGLLFTVCSMIPGLLAGQTFKEQFHELVRNGDAEGQFELLQRWEATDSNDAELHIAFFNYYFKKSKMAVLELGHRPGEGDALVIMDKDTTIEEPVAFLYDATYHDPELLQQGFDHISRGIQAYPDRLDMRFGKIYAHGQVEDFASFAQELIAASDHSATIDHRWLWSDGQPLDEPLEFFLGNIQSYQMELYNTGDDDQLIHMAAIAEAVLKHHPKHIESLSNIAITHLLRDETNEALEILHRAHKIAPKDEIILGNIAHAYMVLEDRGKALEYYRLMDQHSEGESKEFARQQIEILERK